MNRPGHQFLAAAALPLDQYGERRSRGSNECRSQAAHRLAVADQVGDVRRFGGRPAALRGGVQRRRHGRSRHRQQGGRIGRQHGEARGPTRPQRAGDRAAIPNRKDAVGGPVQVDRRYSRPASQHLGDSAPGAGTGAQLRNDPQVFPLRDEEGQRRGAETVAEHRQDPSERGCLVFDALAQLEYAEEV